MLSFSLCCIAFGLTVFMFATYPVTSAIIGTVAVFLCLLSFSFVYVKVVLFYQERKKQNIKKYKELKQELIDKYPQLKHRLPND